MYAVKLLIGEGHGGTRTGQGRNLDRYEQDMIGVNMSGRAEIHRKKYKMGARIIFKGAY